MGPVLRYVPLIWMDMHSAQIYVSIHALPQAHHVGTHPRSWYSLQGIFEFLENFEDFLQFCIFAI